MQKYSATMRYIEGSSLSESDLKRCHVYKAEAVIILSDKFSFDAEIEDTETILQAMFIKNFLSQLKKSQDPYYKEIDFGTRVCMQLLRPESITNYELSLNAEERLNDQIVCIESMKLSLLSKSCLCPGLIVLITNLIKSSGSPYDYLENYKEDPNYSWLYDYWIGKGYEIYRVKIGPNYADRLFCELAAEVYKESGLLLFALEMVVNDKTKGDILLNPGNYRLPRPFSKANRYQYYGYLIADDEETAI